MGVGTDRLSKPGGRCEVAGVEGVHGEGVGGGQGVGFGNHAVLHRGRQNAIACGADVGMGQHGLVDATPSSLYKGHRFPLSLRDVEKMMAERGVSVSYDTIHQWCRKFGQTYANGLRRRRPRPGDQWHLHEVFIKIAGQTHYLWRAVDQQGTVLDILVTSAFSGISPHFRPRRHRLHADEYHREMAIRSTTWNQVVGLSTTA